MKTKSCCSLESKNTFKDILLSAGIRRFALWQRSLLMDSISILTKLCACNCFAAVWNNQLISSKDIIWRGKHSRVFFSSGWILLPTFIPSGWIFSSSVYSIRLDDADEKENKKKAREEMLKTANMRWDGWLSFSSSPLSSYSSYKMGRLTS